VSSSGAERLPFSAGFATKRVTADRSVAKSCGIRD
jgi:hypothetical protein